jgi:hypothetical protein
MTYIDFRMEPAPAPDHEADSAVEPPLPAKPARRTSDRSALLMTSGLVVTIMALFFALALASIREPFTAAIVTIIVLLPAASLLGGDKRHR